MRVDSWHSSEEMEEIDDLSKKYDIQLDHNI